jgi:hypothetical protein
LDLWVSSVAAVADEPRVFGEGASECSRNTMVSLRLPGHAELTARMRRSRAGTTIWMFTLRPVVLRFGGSPPVVDGDQGAVDNPQLPAVRRRRSPEFGEVWGEPVDDAVHC